MHSTNPTKIARLIALLPKNVQENFKVFLQRNVDVFAWSHEDMPGIDPHVIAHRLNVGPNHRLVKQKPRWVYMDFTNLNKACLKDYFPLPRIDQLVNATISHQLLSSWMQIQVTTKS